MKIFTTLSLLVLLIYGCGAVKDREIPDHSTTGDTVTIENDSLNFKLIVFEPDFDRWLATELPMESYDLGYLKQKNRVYTTEYNRRANDPKQSDLYPNKINYDPQLDYGLKLNYMLYMYYEFFQEKYKQDL